MCEKVENRPLSMRRFLYIIKIKSKIRIVHFRACTSTDQNINEKRN